jgi:hypothetical protein
MNNTIVIPNGYRDINEDLNVNFWREFLELNSKLLINNSIDFEIEDNIHCEEDNTYISYIAITRNVTAYDNDTNNDFFFENLFDYTDFMKIIHTLNYLMEIHSLDEVE